jgi:hypothetical protein
MFYSDTSIFRIHDWLISHSQLLIRSARREDDADSENVDLIFRHVNYLEITDIFRGIEITQAEPAEIELLNSKLDYPSSGGDQFFKIVSCGHSYFIVAGTFHVERNKHGIMESSLGYWPLTKSYLPKENWNAE